MRRIPRYRHRYFAFLSYSHKDKEIADWLHDELEEFRVPHGLAGRLTETGVIPKRLRPIFRDRHELAAADDLGEEIVAALASSQYLIVLCSPDAAKSQWTNAEIEMFKRTRPDGCVLAAIASGEPFASDIPGREDEECFPPALRQKYDRRGRPTGKRAEPLAADLRESGDGRRLGFLRLVAGMLGIGLDDLVQRDQTRRQRRLAWLAAASLAGMAVTSGLAITAIQARDAARDQRREAEGLIGFMLGDLKDKLEPIGKLDALDGVGARVLAYYQKLDTSKLSDAALLQRSRALSLMGEVAILRGDLDGASRLYREASAGTAEAIRRNPDDPQRLYDHAQNQFYFADIAMRRGRVDSAESAFREYKRLADRMVELAPDNMKWRMEVQNADANLATVLSQRRRFNEAATQWAQAYRMIEALATADPNNRDYQQSLVESLAWYADAEMDAGHLDNAIALRLRNVDLLTRLANQTQDVNYQYRLNSCRACPGQPLRISGSNGSGAAAYARGRRAGRSPRAYRTRQHEMARIWSEGKERPCRFPSPNRRDGRSAWNKRSGLQHSRSPPQQGRKSARMACELERLLDAPRAIGPCRRIESRGGERYRAGGGNSKDSQGGRSRRRPLYARQVLSATRRHAAKRRRRGWRHHRLAGCYCRAAVGIG